MTNGMISIFPSSTSLTYVVTFQLYIATYSICKSLLDIRSVFSSRQSTDKLVDVKGVSTVSFTGSFPQILWSLQRSYLPMQPFFGPHAVWYVSYMYQSLSRSWHTDLDYGLYRLPNLEIGLTAGVTGLQGMLLHGTWSHLRYIQRSVYAHSPIGLLRLITLRYFCHLYWKMPSASQHQTNYILPLIAITVMEGLQDEWQTF
jgi:hypothetical protein